MKRKFTKLMMSGLFLVGMNFGVNAQGTYNGNSDWSEIPAKYGLILDENFKDWNVPGIMRSATADCNSANRGDLDNYSVEGPVEVKRPVHADQELPYAKLSFFLDFCQIQPNCDTQSGENYAKFPDILDGRDYKGPSWGKVSAGLISIYDNYSSVRNPEVFPGVGDYVDSEGKLQFDGAGSVTTSKIAELERIQYAASNLVRKKMV